MTCQVYQSQPGSTLVCSSVSVEDCVVRGHCLLQCQCRGLHGAWPLFVAVSV